jgi:hypothetical protein
MVTTLVTHQTKHQARRLQVRKGERHSKVKVTLTPLGSQLKKVTAGADVDKLDMVLQNLPPAPYITVQSVRPGAWAAIAGIVAGSEIVEINSVLAKDMNQQEFVQAMKVRPLTILFKVKREGSDEAVVASTTHPPVQVPPEVAKKGGDAADSYKTAYAAGREAGHKAGTAAAKQLVDQAKKDVEEKVVKPAVEKVKEVKEAIKELAKQTAPAPSALAVTVPTLPPMVVQPLPFGPAPSMAPSGAPGAPIPLPPSPMDALRAAMGIRAGVSISGGPQLSPEVMAHVAQMAQGHLGNFLPPGLMDHLMPCARGPSPAPAPAPAVGIPVPKVAVSLTLKHVSFTALQASAALMAETEASAKQSIAESAGVNPSDVEVSLKAGSVEVDGLVAAPEGKNISDVNNAMVQNSHLLSARMVARVKKLPNIESVALGEITCTAPVVKIVETFVPTPTTTTTPAPVRHLPRPPACAAAPKKLTKGDVAMALAPFKPAGAQGKAVKTKDGGSAWPLQDGGWAFQYPDMAVRMQQDGATKIVWNKPAYAVEYDESGISYHVGDNVVHRDTNGDLTYQQPTGTMHQEGQTLVYHWCNPNVIVYETPNGLVYYDDLGMTYRSLGKDITHYTWSGDVLYQGAGGVTRQSVDGTVTHWTDAGAVFRHPDGSVSYTPLGERTSQPLSVSDMAAESPFLGKTLTAEDVMQMSVPPPLPVAPAPAPDVEVAPAPGSGDETDT